MNKFEVVVIFNPDLSTTILDTEIEKKLNEDHKNFRSALENGRFLISLNDIHSKF